MLYFVTYKSSYLHLNFKSLIIIMMEFVRSKKKKKKIISCYSYSSWYKNTSYWLGWRKKDQGKSCLNLKYEETVTLQHLVNIASTKQYNYYYYFIVYDIINLSTDIEIIIILIFIVKGRPYNTNLKYKNKYDFLLDLRYD